MIPAWARRHVTTIVLCTLAAALAVVAWVDRKSITTDEAKLHRGRLLPAWRTDDLRSLRVTRGDERYELASEPRDEEGDRPWQLVAGGSTFEADQQEVGQLLAALELARFERRVDADGIAAEQLGLEQPTLTFEIDMGELRFTLRVGAEAPTPTHGRYARVDADGAGPVVVISAELFASLNRAAADLRAREVVPYPSSAFEQIALLEASGDERFVLQRQRSGPEPVYRLTSPDGDGTVRADRRVVRSLLVDLAELEATRFVAPPDASAGSDRPAWSLRIQVATVEPFQLRLDVYGACTGSSGTLVMRTGRTPQSACVDSQRLARLNVTTRQLVDRHVVGAAPTAISEVQMQSGTIAIDAARKGTGWHLRKPRDGTADDQAVDRWLEALVAAEGELLPADEARDLAARGLDPPRATGRIVSVGGPGDADAERIEAIEVGNEVAGRVFVRRAEDGALLSLTTSAAAALVPSVSSLRPVQVLQLAEADFRSLQVQAGPVRQKVTRRSADDDWKLRQPQGRGLRADPALITQLARELADLKALEWVADEPGDSFGLASPRCVVQLETDRAIRLQLGGEANGGYYAQVDDDSSVFIAPKRIAALAEQWWIDRASLMVNTATAERITVTDSRSQRALVVVQQQGRWSVQTGTPTTPATAITVRDTLRDLLAETATSVGAPSAADGLEPPVLTLRVEHRSDGSDAAPPRRTVVLQIGAGDVRGNLRVHPVRRDDVAATFAVAQARLQPLFDLF